MVRVRACSRAAISHSARFNFRGANRVVAAQLQANQALGGLSVLIRIETKAGHGSGKPIAKVIDEYADEWAFFIRALGAR